MYSVWTAVGDPAGLCGVPAIMWILLRRCASLISPVSALASPALAGGVAVDSSAHADHRRSRRFALTASANVRMILGLAKLSEHLYTGGQERGPTLRRQSSPFGFCPVSTST